jgi:hypothetical protein
MVVRYVSDWKDRTLPERLLGLALGTLADPRPERGDAYGEGRLEMGGGMSNGASPSQDAVAAPTSTSVVGEMAASSGRLSLFAGGRWPFIAKNLNC